MHYDIHQGDCRDWMPTLDPDSIDALVTDPPAGISFMGKQWDSHSTYVPRTERAKVLIEVAEALGLERWEAGFAAFTADWAAEAFRVLKPGAHGLVWAIPRTADLTGLGLRAAGFEVRNSVAHIFGSGFPKSLNVSKAIDDFLGAERPVIGTKEQRNPYIGSDGLQFRDAPDYTGQEEQITAAGSPEAAQWEGWGTDLKPSQETWILIRKPLAEDTVAANVLKHGVGALNIDDCRVDAQGDSLMGGHSTGSVKGKHEWWQRPWMQDPEKVAANAAEAMERTLKAEQMGRWPSNIVFTHHPDCKRVGTKKVKGDGHYPAERGAGGLGTSGHSGQTGLDEQHLTEETVDAWECVEGCPIKAIDEQAGPSSVTGNRTERSKGTTVEGTTWGTNNHKSKEYPNESGAVSRFFPQFGWTTDDLQTALFLYCAKASRSERNAKCDELDERPLQWSSGEQNPGSFQAPGTKKAAKNFHPTVKPIELMRWLCRLITPPKGTVLDPFLGSGSTMKAAIEEGFNCIGCERDADYVKIARARIGGDQLRFDLFAAVSQ